MLQCCAGSFYALERNNSRTWFSLVGEQKRKLKPYKAIEPNRGEDSSLDASFKLGMKVFARACMGKISLSIILKGYRRRID